MQGDNVTASSIRTARLENQNMRDRDVADLLNISEAQLNAAHVGQGVTRINADLDAVMEQVQRLGEVMALTRNESCVIEKVGIYDKYHSGAHASMILNEDIDLRMFGKHWVHGFAIEKETDKGLSRSLQVFDAAGDAVHKIFLRDTSVVEEWDNVVDSLRLADQGDTLAVDPRHPVEDAKGDTAKADTLRAEWDKMTDTHQFMGLTRKLKMNRLGAYRMAGAPYVEKLQPGAVGQILEQAAETQTPMMAFVGNMGCIEIHTGPIETVKRMGPWLNVLDARFNLHLREDHIAEVWAVTKYTKRGPAISVEAFRKDGLIIAQFFGVLRGDDRAAGWNALVADLPRETEAAVA